MVITGLWWSGLPGTVLALTGDHHDHHLYYHLDDYDNFDHLDDHGDYVYQDDRGDYVRQNGHYDDWDDDDRDEDKV